ncbi:tetratricopeptide repeat protein [Pseudomonas sp. ABC1]|uniref:tetratricopeptide repeat protein n=1 Tax=Pseudomonas sp. ABC1 TaxID=2748080 RepID=UPI0015C3D823|nr:tetratricopeptide repeat protein [Pseudomonas sp. ABC1]QLF92013.1 tetratricopeptide repeat protein [Pseudomonas sp. ABC1]
MRFPLPCLLLAGLISLTGCASMSGGNPLASGKPPAISKEAEEALRLARVLRDNGRLQAAYEVYERMDQRKQLEGAYLLEYASIAAAVRPQQEALSLYGRARQQLGGDLQDIAPGQRIALCNGVGRARLALGQPKGAISDFQCALQVDPQNAQALNGFGVALNITGDTEGARQQFEKVLEHEPGNGAAANNLALSWLASGENQRAINLLNQARNGSPDAALQLNLALAYVLEGHDDTARRVLLESMQPSFAERVLEDFRATRQRIAAGAPLAQELLAASQRPLALSEQD